MIFELTTSSILVWLIWWILSTYQERKGMPPGPFPLPFIGNLLQMRFNMLVAFDKMWEKYGDIYTLSLPNGTAVVVNSGELAREALITRIDDMAGRLPDAVFPAAIIFEGTDIAIENYGARHSFRRKVFKTAMHIYGGVGVEEAGQRAYEGAEKLLSEIEEMNGEPCSPIKHVRLAIISSLWQWLTSKNYPLHHPTVNLIDVYDKKFSELMSFGILYKFSPLIKYCASAIFNKRLKDVENMREDIFMSELQEHFETYMGVNRDLIDSFISGYKKEIEKESVKDIGSIGDVKGLMMDIIFAGVDSSAANISWVILYILLHHELQEKIHNELDEVVGKDRSPTWKDSENLHYLQATILEVMRHSPAVPFLVRNAYRDTEINGFSIPKGTAVFFNNYRINKQWPDDNSFKPERFLDVNGKFVGWSSKFFPYFTPFGLGVRNCPGQSLAKVQLISFVSALLHRFKFQAMEDEPSPKLEGTFNPVIYPNDYKVVAVKRI